MEYLIHIKVIVEIETNKRSWRDEKQFEDIESFCDEMLSGADKYTDSISTLQALIKDRYLKYTKQETDNPPQGEKGEQ